MCGGPHGRLKQGLKDLAALGRTDILWCILCTCELSINRLEPITDTFNLGYGLGMDRGGGGRLVGGVGGLGLGDGQGYLGLGWCGRC